MTGQEILETTRLVTDGPNADLELHRQGRGFDAVRRCHLTEWAVASLSKDTGPQVAWAQSLARVLLDQRSNDH